jgi:transcription initiation factor TFIIIB Brf1 subunit/transcription initiation factor TFIIB
MTCKECGSNSFDFNERLGERVCNNCGLVNIEEIFERTASGKIEAFDSYGNRAQQFRTADSKGNLGSNIGHAKGKVAHKLRRTAQISRDSREETLIRGISYCNLIIGEYTSSKSIREQINANYRKLMEVKALSGSTYEERAAAIVFFTMKENGMGISIKDLARKSGADTGRIHKLARKIARVFCRPWVLSQSNNCAELEKLGLDMNMKRIFIKECNTVLAALTPIIEHEGGK